MFDARQLARWGIRESTLPAGSEVLFREPSFFQRNKNLALVILAVVALQAAIIGMLLIERRVRRRDEAQNHAVLTSMSADLAVIDRRGHVVSSNDGWARAAAAAENPFVSAGRGQAVAAGRRRSSAGRAVTRPGCAKRWSAVLEGDRRGARSSSTAWQANGQRKWSHVRVRRLLGRAWRRRGHARRHLGEEARRNRRAADAARAGASQRAGGHGRDPRVGGARGQPAADGVADQRAGAEAPPRRQSGRAAGSRRYPGGHHRGRSPRDRRARRHPQDAAQGGVRSAAAPFERGRRAMSCAR